MEWIVYRFLLRLVSLMSNEQIQLRRHGIRDLEVCDVTMDELAQLEKEGSDVGFDFQVAQFCMTLAGSFLTGLILSPPPPDARRTFDVFVSLVIIGFFLGAIFGIKWFRSRGAFSATLKRIRSRQIGPVGDEGHQIQASDLAILEPQAPPITPQEGGDNDRR